MTANVTISRPGGGQIIVNRTGYLQPRRLNIAVPCVGAPLNNEVFGLFSAADAATLVTTDCIGGAGTAPTSAYTVTVRKVSDGSQVATAVFSAGNPVPVFTALQPMVKGTRYKIDGSGIDATMKDFDVNFVWLVG